MKRMLVVALTVFAGLSILLAESPQKWTRTLGGRSTVATRILDINRLWLDITDRGYLNFDSSWWSAGSRWWTSAAHGYGVVYDQGPWIIGKFNGAPAAGTTLWRSSYSPGPVISGKPALDVQPGDSLRYHPYKISRGSAQDSDAVNWPVDLGAPVDGQGKPRILGDQMIWSVFNAADTNLFADGWGPDQTRRRKEQFPRLPVEIRHAVYAQKAESLADTSLLANTVFQEWTFINRGSAPVESCYVGLWADIDIDAGMWNFTAVDTTLQLGYLWIDTSRYHQPFAVGYSLLYGPAVPSPGHTALFQGEARPGYRNLPLNSFLGIAQNWGRDSLFGSAPYRLKPAWNVARGFDKVGNVIIDSVTGQPTRFPFSGDPVTGSGWIDNRNNPGEAGILMFAGPFTLAAGDSQWMMAALVTADAGEPVASITLLRDHAARLRSLSYQEIAHPQPLAVDMNQPTLPGGARLFQNYPNPFNPSTTMKFELPKTSMVRLSVCDILGREVSVLVNERKNAGSYEVKFDASGLASGVYFYRLQAGAFVQTRRLLFLR